jgi:hypothetical protein
MLALLLLTSMFPSDILAAQVGPQAEIFAATRDGCIFVVLFFSGVALITGFVSVLKRRKILASES